jgi:5-(carboxyamino)imidazole ribonucleotide synthase
MMCEAASVLGVPTVVLAARADDAAVPTAGEVLFGEPADGQALRALAERCEVVTFDHEQVDLDLLGDLEREAVTLRPGTETLRIAVDKAEMRTQLSAAGLPVPRYKVLGVAGIPGHSPDELVSEMTRFAAPKGWPVVVKAARGGYDGRGVWFVHNAEAALVVCEEAARAARPLIVEELVDVEVEVAAVVARGPDGSVAAWPPVETAQVEGVCREVRYPGRLDPRLAADAAAIAREIATVVGMVGVLAVELFAGGGRLLVNEIAARPHNSAHWTIEGSTTSQFENHVRAVLGLPLGDTCPAAPQVASVNVFGMPSASGPNLRERLAAALRVQGAHVHVYGKAARPGRKLGHVTVCGEDPSDVRARAWAAARALGTPIPDSVGADRP